MEGSEAYFGLHYVERSVAMPNSEADCYNVRPAPFLAQSVLLQSCKIVQITVTKIDLKFNPQRKVIARVKSAPLS